ncbi:uncharacterized protein H6S33_007962 [Morchella sextelata]|uniref:uncharacterized protein n=1 Tax=Morchella sextelata TaxID=1174677 RepID=UPI001D040BD5|nr:uncharacterized protein H6S33_007962 [Morchella sextelata]KAH0602958.1 hypothetical protein H6S33_007962 [Morchella sextelata]
MDGGTRTAVLLPVGVVEAMRGLSGVEGEAVRSKVEPVLWLIRITTGGNLLLRLERWGNGTQKIFGELLRLFRFDILYSTLCGGACNRARLFVRKKSSRIFLN